jgi:hypothetical protein
LAVWLSVVAVLLGVVSFSMLADHSTQLPSPRRSDNVDREIIYTLRARLPRAYELAGPGGRELESLADGLQSQATAAARVRAGKFGDDEVVAAYKGFAARAGDLSDVATSGSDSASQDRLAALLALASAGDQLAAATVPPPAS